MEWLICVYMNIILFNTVDYNDTTSTRFVSLCNGFRNIDVNITEIFSRVQSTFGQCGSIGISISYLCDTVSFLEVISSSCTISPRDVIIVIGVCGIELWVQCTVWTRCRPCVRTPYRDWWDDYFIRRCMILFLSGSDYLEVCSMNACDPCRDGYHSYEVI